MLVMPNLNAVATYKVGHLSSHHIPGNIRLCQQNLLRLKSLHNTKLWQAVLFTTAVKSLKCWMEMCKLQCATMPAMACGAAHNQARSCSESRRTASQALSNISHNNKHILLLLLAPIKSTEQPGTAHCTEDLTGTVNSQTAFPYSSTMSPLPVGC